MTILQEEGGIRGLPELDHRVPRCADWCIVRCPSTSVNYAR